MDLAHLRPELLRRMAIALPAGVLLLASLLVVPRAAGIWRVSRQLTARRQAVALSCRQNRLEAAARDRQPLPAPPQTRDEPLVFLNQLTRLVTTSHVRLVAYRPTESSGDAEHEHPPSLRGVPGAADSTAAEGAPLKPMVTEVTIAGSFPHLVAMFQQLASADRLFVVDRLQVQADQYPNLSAAFRLVRYVTPAAPASGGYPAAVSSESPQRF